MSDAATYSTLSGTKKLRVQRTDVNDGGVTLHDPEESVTEEWELKFSPRFTDDQWVTFRARSDEAYDRQAKTYDMERLKTLILSIAPDTTFLGSV